MIVQFENASFHHGTTPVLRAVSTSIETGQFTCLLGPNGAGKTTLIRLITGEIGLTEGHLSLLAGTDPISLTDIHQHVAVVPQNVQDPPYITVRELIELGRFSPRKGLGWRLSSEDHEIVDAALESCDMTQLADRPFTKISGGQKQRAWLGFCLAKQKDMVILDESLQGVDYFSQQFFFGLLKDIAAQDKAVVLITHDLDLAARFADNVLVLKDGVLVYDGPPTDDLPSLLIGDRAA